MRLLPLAARLPRSRRRLLAAASVVVLALLAASAVHAATGIGGSEVDIGLRDWGTSLMALVCAVVITLRAVRIPEARVAWGTLAAGAWLYFAGNLVWGVAGLTSYPSPSDVLWLSLYPASYATLVLLVREHRERLPVTMVLDGVVAGLGLAAIGAAVVLQDAVDKTRGDTAEAITAMAYPLADLVLAALVMGALALRGWRPNRMWSMLGTGFLGLAVGDSLLFLEGTGTDHISSLSTVVYIVGAGTLAASAWQLPTVEPRQQPSGWSPLAVPAVFLVVTFGLLVYDHFNPLNGLALVLAFLTVLAALARTAVSFREVQRFGEVQRLALTDDLTSLPNRRQLLFRVEGAIAQARRRGESAALLIVDLDHFKELNDTLGHQAGDLLLNQIGPRLASGLRTSDALARLGGDEFGIVLESPVDGVAALTVADKLRAELTQPFQVGDLCMHVTASVGIALYPEHGEDTEELLQRADVAMYQAKASRSGSELYARDRDTHSRERLALVGQLRGALERGEIEAFFQPKVTAGRRRIAGVEALARWRHPERGLLSPGAFLPLIEQAGLARQLTRCVLRQALSRLREWREEGYDLHVAVNMSAVDLIDTHLPTEIARMLERHRIPAEALVIEITESSVLSDPVRIGRVLGELTDLGVALSLDDFGTGYSTLAHLKTLPVTELKIDRSFVGKMAHDHADEAIVSSTIRLAHDLGMRVIGEGVEDEETWQLLDHLGCDVVQGYAFSRPVPSEEILEKLDRAGFRPVTMAPSR